MKTETATTPAARRYDLLPETDQASTEQSQTTGKSQRFSTLRWKIAAWMLLTTCITIIALIYSVRAVLQQDVEQASNAAVTHEIDEFHHFAALQAESNPTSLQDADALLRTYMEGQHSEYSEQLIGVTSSTLLFLKTTEDYAQEQGYMPHQDSELISALTSTADVSGISETPAGPVRWGKVNIKSSDTAPVTGQLLVIEFMQPQLDQVHSTSTRMAAVGAASLLLTVAVSWIVAGYISRPISQLRTVAADISGNNISGRVPVTGNDDVAAMSETFNQMLDRIEEFSTVQRQFLDDVSHELRTPITIVRGHLELLDRNSEQEATLALVDDELDRMGRIVGDLLLLAKAERPDFIKPVTEDVAGLLIDLDSKVQAFTSHRWTVSQIAEGEVTLDAQRITQAMIQYCANATQYSPAGSLISLGSGYREHQGNRYFELWVEDRGEGIDLTETPALFTRFERNHQRNQEDIHSDTKNIGLGLAIIKAIADAHHGFVWTALPEGGQPGSIFGISVPAPEKN